MKILEIPLKRQQKNSWISNRDDNMSHHCPVMVEEVLSYLKLLPGKAIVDCTVGEGGHSEGILRKITPGGQLIGIDQDDDALSITRLRLSRFEESCQLVQTNFRQIREVILTCGLEKVDGIVFDLGISMLQLSSPERGFSFRLDGPLNMRMDKQGQITAFDLVNNLSVEEIANIIYKFGEERHSRKIARRIVELRHQSPISTTQQLADIVFESYPFRERHRRTHPATKTFMALRIAVNREFEALETGLRDAIDMLKPGGRICVISFHSLEDRIVKHEFRAQAKEGIIKLITKKPLIPTDEEILKNAPSRSAKLRVAEKI